MGWGSWDGVGVRIGALAERLLELVTAGEGVAWTAVDLTRFADGVEVPLVCKTARLSQDGGTETANIMAHWLVKGQPLGLAGAALPCGRCRPFGRPLPAARGRGRLVGCGGGSGGGGVYALLQSDQLLLDSLQ